MGFLRPQRSAPSSYLEDQQVPAPVASPKMMRVSFRVTRTKITIISRIYFFVSVLITGVRTMTVYHSYMANKLSE